MFNDGKKGKSTFEYANRQTHVQTQQTLKNTLSGHTLSWTGHVGPSKPDTSAPKKFTVHIQAEILSGMRKTGEQWKCSTTH